MQVSISIDPELVELVDKQAGPQKRSEAIERAIETAYRDRKMLLWREITAKLEEARRAGLDIDMNLRGGMTHANK
jgi:metal-responsive CopG/Arc/MetJ family transcriptional regulator